MNLATGVIFCLMVTMVFGAAANHCCAGVHIRSTKPAIRLSAITRMRAALTLRGTLSLCSPSTGPDRTSASSRANAIGMNAACATYNSKPIAPRTSVFAAHICRARAGAGAAGIFDWSACKNTLPKQSGPVTAAVRDASQKMHRHRCAAAPQTRTARESTARRFGF